MSFLGAICAIVMTAPGCSVGVWLFDNIGRFVGYVPTVTIRKANSESALVKKSL